MEEDIKKEIKEQLKIEDENLINIIIEKFNNIESAQSYLDKIKVVHQISKNKEEFVSNINKVYPKQYDGDFDNLMKLFLQVPPLKKKE